VRHPTGSRHQKTRATAGDAFFTQRLGICFRSGRLLALNEVNGSGGRIFLAAQLADGVTHLLFRAKGGRREKCTHGVRQAQK